METDLPYGTRELSDGPAALESSDRDGHRVLTPGLRVLRRAILAAAESPRLQRLVRRHGMRLGASRFVAGETLDQAVVVLRRLNDQGLRANTTLLGEGVVNEARDPRRRRRLQRRSSIASRPSGCA